MDVKLYTKINTKITLSFGNRKDVLGLDRLKCVHHNQIINLVLKCSRFKFVHVLK